jgi:hypothetical protein
MRQLASCLLSLYVLPTSSGTDTARRRVGAACLCHSSLLQLMPCWMVQANQAPGWLKALKQEGPLVPETEEYGIGSYVYRARRPFHPGRLYHNFLTKYFLTKAVEVEVEVVEEGQDQGDSRWGQPAAAWPDWPSCWCTVLVHSYSICRWQVHSSELDVTRCSYLLA